MMNLITQEKFQEMDARIGKLETEKRELHALLEYMTRVIEDAEISEDVTKNMRHIRARL